MLKKTIQFFLIALLFLSSGGNLRAQPSAGNGHSMVQHQQTAANHEQFQQIIAEKSFNFDPESIAHGLLGLFVLLLVAWVFSTNRKAISWATVGKGLFLQFVIAVSVLFFSPAQDFFNFFGKCFVTVLAWTRAGSEFMFGSLLNTQQFGFIYAFQIVPTIIFFAALTSLLFYLGIIQRIVALFAHLLKKVIKLSGAESLVTVGNIFLGMSEAPFLVKPYIASMTRSEVMLMMTAGMATMAGGILATYIQMLGNGVPALEVEFAKHLLSASVMAASGAVVVSKILVPETETFVAEAKVAKEQAGRNVLDAISNGTIDGLKLAINVSAMLLVFYALIAGINFLLQFFGDSSLLTLATLSGGFTAGCAATYFFQQNKQPKKRTWLQLAAGVLLAVGLAQYYIAGHYAHTNIGGMLASLNKVFPIGSFVLSIALGVLAGSFSTCSLLKRDRLQQPVTLYTATVGLLILIVLFGTLACLHGTSTSLNEFIAASTNQQYTALTMQFVLGQIFSPLMWLIGISLDDVSLAGQLLGQKLILTEFVGYRELSKMLAAGSFSDPKSVIMSTYILCGFANFASVGMIIGTVGSLAPNQKPLLSAFGMRALLGGTLTALISATMVGMML